MPDGDSPLYTETLELLARAREGDERSYARLYQRYFERLRWWSSGRLPASARDLVDTQDLVQEVLIRSLKRVDEFDQRFEGAFQSYLKRGILNAIRDRIRRAKDRAGVESHEAELLEQDPSPLEAAIGAENVRRYEAALARLAPRDQEAIVARIEMQCSYEELKEALGSPSEDAARMAVKRALLRLAEELQDG